MAGTNQGGGRNTAQPETGEIEVDLSQTDPDKAVTRRAKPQASRDPDDGEDTPRGRQHTKAEREMFKRMARMQRTLTRDFNQKMADQQAAHQREISDLRKAGGSTGLVREEADTAKDAHEAKMADFQAKLEAAIERGDSASQARITTEMMRADGAYHAKLSGTQQRRDTAGEASPAPTKVPGTTQQGPTAAGSRFILANEDWWEDPEFEVEKALASTLYVKLVQEDGYDANSDATFREVTRLMRSRFPDLPLQSVKRGKAADRDDELDPNDPEDDAGNDAGTRGDDRRTSTVRPHRAAAQNFSDRGDAGRGNANKQTLGKVEIATMLASGMDPKNNAHVVAFLQENVAYDQQEGGRR